MKKKRNIALLLLIIIIVVFIILVGIKIRKNVSNDETTKEGSKEETKIDEKVSNDEESIDDDAEENVVDNEIKEETKNSIKTTNKIKNKTELVEEKEDDTMSNVEEKQDDTMSNVEEKQDDIKIIKISNMLRGRTKSELEEYEDYIGDFIKINGVTLSKFGLNYSGEYYVNLVSGEVYDISGEEIQGITYHTIDQYYQIVNSEDINKTKELMQIRQNEINEINNLQFNNGAYASYSKNVNSTSKINSYFNCIGMLGIIDDIESLDNVKKYINWHFKHINEVDIDGNVGTIYDYDITSNELETFNKDNLYDSIDSYASMFFVLLDKYYEKTGDKSIFLENTDNLLRVEQALNTMFNYSNNLNLTIAKSQYPIYYLMDNCESYAGYISLANIYNNIYSNSDKSNFYKNRAGLIKEAINNVLWNEENTLNQFHSYDYAYSNSSYTGLFEKRIYYPYVLSQIYPVLYEVVDIDSEKSKHLYYLHKFYSDWSYDMKNYCYTFSHNDDKYPHFESLVVALMYNNTDFSVNYYDIDINDDIEKAIDVILNNYRKNEYNYYFSIAERGYLVKALNMYMNK